MSILEAVKKSDRRAALQAQWEVLAAALESASDDQLPGLSRELRLVGQELEGLGTPAGKESVKDALAARRAAKKASTG